MAAVARLAAAGLAFGVLINLASGAEVNFCIGRDALPSSGDAGTIEVAIAKAVARRLDVTARFLWLHPRSESLEEAVVGGRCDAAMGLIVDPGPLAGDRSFPGLKLTRPYYDAAYLIIRRAGTAPLRSLSDLGETRVATEATSTAVFTLRQLGARLSVLARPEAVIDAVADGREVYGYLWGPLASRLIGGRTDVILDANFEPVERWSFAVGVREVDSDLRADLDAALDELRDSGEIVRLFHAGQLRFLAPRPLVERLRG